MRILAQKLKDGSVRVVEAPSPLLVPGSVRVRTLFSAISPGTEGNKIVTGRKSLLGKARARPEQARQVLEMVGQLGWRETLQKVRDKLEGAQPLGYSLCGRVIEVAPGVEKVAPGDLAACAGGGYANHADEVVVPVNLVARVPDEVAPDEAALTTLAAIALQGVRLAEPEIGDQALVVGLGIIGQMACELLKAAGCRVFGTDVSPAAVARTRELGLADGAACLADEAAEAAIEDFCRGRGADLVLICAATPSDEPVALAGRAARKRGRVVVVGAVGMDLPRPDYYEKELTFRVSCSYGPGRYDPAYEEGGIDYPYGFVRWTEGRNMEAVLDLVARDRFHPLRLVTHRFPFDAAPRAYAMIADRSEPFGGILLEYPPAEPEPVSRLELGSRRTVTHGRIGVGMIGAGSFAQSFLLPPLSRQKGIAFTAIFTRGGLSATDVGKRYGFRAAVASAEEVIADEETAAVVIATRHDQHGPLVLQALEHGKHVFVEKPLCLRREELGAIAALARHRLAGDGMPLLQVGFNRRFAPAARKVVDHFRGYDGPLTMLCRVNAGRIPRDHWIQDPDVGGGRIVGEVCHFIDLLQFFCDSVPVAVSAACIRTGDEAVFARDNLVVNLSFADGSVGTICYVGEGASGLPKEYYEVHGAGRSAILDNFSRVRLLDGRRTRTARTSGKGHAQEMEAFARSLRGGEPPIPLHSLLATTLATFSIQESLAAGGRVVAVDPDTLPGSG